MTTAPSATASDDGAPRRRRGGFGLQARAAVGFGLTGLVVAVVLGGVTYGVSRGYLVDQREDVAVTQTFVNARLARNVLRAPEPDVRALLAGLEGGTASTTFLRYRGQWFSTSVAVRPESMPVDLVRSVSAGRAGHQRFRDPDGDLVLAVGVAVPAVDAVYFELFPLAELEDILALLARSLALGVTGAAVTAAVVGLAAARRLVKPLGPVADAAERMAAGALDTRISSAPDPDLRRLVDAFNSMAAALEARIEREARFAADVSHELRSPLAALASAVDVIERRRDQLPEQVVVAFEVLSAKIGGFQQMVLDLLEISKVDAGTATLDRSPVDLCALLGRVADLHGGADVAVVVPEGAATKVIADGRRLAQALGNIADNADRYGEGLSRITVEAPAGGAVVHILLDDRGPGVPAEERSAIFGRFARGESGLQAGSTTGTGLGLALVAEHVRLHGGRVWVEDAPGGGARFVVELPVGEP
ncbi:MAG: ATP-binding protein [Acidimicrobiales bacterium]